MARFYKDFIKVDPNFIPVFSKNSDKIYPDNGNRFIRTTVSRTFLIKL